MIYIFQLSAYPQTKRTLAAVGKFYERARFYWITGGAGMAAMSTHLLFFSFVGSGS